MAATDELAWEKAHAILARTQQILADRPRVAGAPGNGSAVGAECRFGPLRDLAERGELHDRALWTPLAKALGGPGSTTALVGSYETVAAALIDYTEIGCDLLSIRGWDVYEDAQDYARYVLPLVRQELAHREANGTAPILNPDSDAGAGRARVVTISSSNKVRQVESSAHWGTFVAEVSEDGQLLDVKPYADDPDASPAIANVADANRSRARVAQPSVRRRWLEHGPGPDDRRGDPDDEYVELDWDTALDLAARELDRVRTEHGNEAIFGGSYGWASAGRFHHAQSQLHRFLNRIGGYTKSVNDYSRGASLVTIPHLIGAQGLMDLRMRPVSWAHVAEHTDLLVSFGGLRRSNSWVVPGGHNRHVGSGLRSPRGRQHPDRVPLRAAGRRLLPGRLRVDRDHAGDRHRRDPGADRRADHRRPGRRRVP